MNKNNFSSTYYHAELDVKRLKVSMNNNQVRIIVATQAFGMGINKSDVKAVIHLFLPSRIGISNKLEELEEMREKHLLICS